MTSKQENISKTVLEAIHRLQEALGIDISPHDGASRSGYCSLVWLSNAAHARSLESIIHSIPGRKHVGINVAPAADEPVDSFRGVSLLIGSQINDKEMLVEEIDKMTGLIRQHELKLQYERAMELYTHQAGWLQDADSYPRLDFEGNPHFVLAINTMPGELAKILAHDIGMGFVDRCRIPKAHRELGEMGEAGDKYFEISMDIDDSTFRNVRRHLSEHVERTTRPRNKHPRGSIGGSSLG